MTIPFCVGRHRNRRVAGGSQPIIVSVDMESSPPISPSARGRPRGFDRENALDRAMHVFWERGFDAASLKDLTDAMGIRSPSLYAAFGDKETLFLEAVGRYQDHYAGDIRKALAQLSTRGAVQMLLEAAATRFAGRDGPTGCLVVLSGLALDHIAHPDLAARLAQERRGFEDAIQARLEAGRDDGDLSPDADCVALARYVAMIYQALAVAARQGHTRQQLMTAASRALEGWPAAPAPAESGPASG